MDGTIGRIRRFCANGDQSPNCTPAGAISAARLASANASVLAARRIFAGRRLLWQFSAHVRQRSANIADIFHGKAARLQPPEFE